MQTTNGHIITVPAHLLPHMEIDWNMDVIHDATGAIKRTMTLSGCEFDDDGDVCTLRWQTHNSTLRVIAEDVAPDTKINVWVPTIPAALAAELA